MTGHLSALLKATRSICPPHGVSIPSGPLGRFKPFVTQGVHMGASEPEREREREREGGREGEWIHVTGYVSILPPDSLNHSLARPPQ